MKTRKHIRSLLGLLVGLILVAACAGGTTTPTARPPDRVSLQLQWVTQAQFAGYYVALDKGWYQEEGINLTIVPGGPDITPVDRVAAGTSHFGTTLLADLAVAVQKGKPVVSIAQVQQQNGLILVAFKTSGIQGPKDFRGNQVGVWLGSWEAQFQALMAQEGLAPSDYTLVSQGYSMDAFLGGELDVASAMRYNEYHVVLESGVKAEALNVIDYADYGLGFPGDTLFTSRRLVEENPDLCVRMVRASLRGWQYAIEHPEEAADIVLKYDTTGTQTRPHQLTMMQEIAKLVKPTGSTLGYTDIATVQGMLDLLLEYNVLDGPVQAGDVWNEAFWKQANP
jgi:NitT/TauT family transport system substrate-binding protein